LRQAARGKAVSEYSLTVMGDRYMALYEDVRGATKSHMTHGAGISR